MGYRLFIARRRGYFTNESDFKICTAIVFPAIFLSPVIFGRLVLIAKNGGQIKKA
ncbi:hypothetical protein [Enterococcus canintestini]|uniref:hypothetical protein n=1 Tax=Enterococcus canintestini TaxID=317010 RepID=UPI0039933F2E